MDDRAPGPVIAIDGRSGSGKTDLAGELARAVRLRGGRVLVAHLDDLYPGWDGLEGGVDRLVDGVLAPFCRGERVLRLARWDWARGRDGPVETVRVPPGEVALIVEGVGAGARAAAPFVSLLIWLQAPEPVRRARALTRDGDTFADHWDAWAATERRHLRRERTHERADLVWDTQPDGVP